ncbi:MAG: ATP-dependent zinc metalloprotease FtsH [Desulfovibrionaceae bacterium]
MNQFTKNIAVWLVIAFVVVTLFNMFGTSPESGIKYSYSEFIQHVKSGSIASVTIEGDRISGKTKAGSSFQTYSANDSSLVQTLLTNNVNVNAQAPASSPWYLTILISWFPVLLLIGVWIFFMQKMQGGGGKAMSFGKSRAKMLNQDSTVVTFQDVAGVDEAKEELEEVVEFLANPKKFTRLGGRIPKGILLVGSPGTGKTLLARAVAGEAGVPFLSISGSDFVEMFVGVGASRVRDLFIQGKKLAPCLIFIDEIDAVGRQRGAGMGGGHDEREQTLNQLLVEMDGFEANEGVILIAATNRPDVLDPALLRPGRFDRQVMVSPPDVRGRRRILDVHTKKTPLGKDVDLDIIAKGTPGFAGADLENLVNEAALLAARQNKDILSMKDFEYAKDKLLMGKERRSLVLTEQDKKITAYHEAGHTLVAKLLPGTDPLHKVTIIPRGRALGVTMQLPEDDKHSYSKEYLKNRLVILFGGRVAEKVVFNEITTGAGNDIEQATKLARRMVCEWGMSDKVGTLALNEQSDDIFLGREMKQPRNFSEETAELIDSEIKILITDAYDKCTQLITENRDFLENLTQALLERETISGEDIEKIFRNQKLEPLLDIDNNNTSHKQDTNDLLLTIGDVNDSIHINKESSSE